MYNLMKPPYFSLNIRLLFSDLSGSGFESGFESGSEIRIRNRIRNVYFGSGSDPDPAKSFGSLRIRFRIRIRNTEYLCAQLHPKFNILFCTHFIYCTYCGRQQNKELRVRFYYISAHV